MGIHFSQYLDQYFWISFVLTIACCEDFCDVSFGERARKAFGDLKQSELNGTWIQKCLPTSEKPATKFQNGLLTIMPGAAMRYHRQRGHMSMNSSSQLEIVEAVWIIDLSRFDYDGIERSESERASLWTTGGKLFSRKYREASWSFVVDSSFFVVYLNTHHEVHIAPRERLGSLHLEDGGYLGRSSSANVYTLVLDSISRANLKIMLPKTWALLTKWNLDGHSSHEVFNFKRFRTVQFGGTMQNMFPLWYGGIGLLRADCSKLAHGCGCHAADNIYSETVSSWAECEAYCSAKKSEISSIIACEIKNLTFAGDRSRGGICYAQTTCDLQYSTCGVGGEENACSYAASACGKLWSDQKCKSVMAANTVEVDPEYKPLKCELLDVRSFLADHNDPFTAKSAVLNVTSRARHLFRAFRSAGFETACSTPFHRPPYETVVSDDIDYMFPPVWHMLSEAEASLHENACIGQLPLGMHILNYNEELLRNRQQAPRFIFSHFRATHLALTDRRGIGQHMSMVSRWDTVLEQHLKRVLASDNAPIVIFMSDHGLRNPPCDNDKPFLYMALPRQAFLDDLNQYATESVHQNQNSIVTVWDLYETLKHIAKPSARIPSQDERQVPAELCHYPALGRAVSRIEGVNMSLFRPYSLLNVIPSDRTCAELGVAESTCGRAWTEAYYCGEVEAMSEPTQDLLAPGHNFTRKDCSNFLKWVHVALSHMNVDLHYNLLKFLPAREEELPCVSSLSFGTLELVYLNQPLQQMTFRFSVLEGSPPRVYEAWFGSALPDSEARSATLQEYTQVTRYKKYELCAPRGSVTLCVCGEDKLISDQRKRFIKHCFVDGYTYEECCDMRRPEPRCFDHIYTYEKCCQIAALA